MPGDKVPVDLCCYDESFPAFEETYSKTDSVSSRASSPKSDTTDWNAPSESSESPDGSVISDLEIEADRIANELDNMKITEIQAEEMMKEGADMRHVLQAAYKLKPKVGKKFKKGTKLNGKALMKLLNFETYNEQDDEVDQKQRMARAWAQYEKSLNRKGGWRAPPGFENLDDIIAEKVSNGQEKPECLVSYANGTNSLSLATDPMTLHNITVSCVVDSCRVFLQQMNNPTFVGLKNLESELFSTYSMESAKPLLRPIAHGSVLAVFSDEKWYRCQVVSYNPATDSCDIKFVDHGGYTTVPATDLRQLKSDFLRLPFQAIEVYLAHVEPSKNEMQKDIVSEVLFHANISVQLLGMADDGIPMIQAYYYDGDYVHLFTQEIVDTCTISIETTKIVKSRQSSESSSTEDIPPNTPAYQQYYYPADYYCQESGSNYLPLADNCQPLVQPQPTVAYCYVDPNTNQQVYYLASPYVYPTNTNMTPNSPPSTSEESSEISFGFFESDELQSLTTSSSSSSTSGEEVEKESIDSSEETTESKPFEEWTQEDYALYYGQ